MKLQNHGKLEQYKSINPFDQSDVKSYVIEDWDSLEQKLIQTAKNYISGTNLTHQERADNLKIIAEQLLMRKVELGEIMTLEMGKPIQQAIAEVEKCAWVCQYYAEHAKEFIQQKIVQTDFKSSYVNYLPIGTVLAIMPWNFPYWQFFRVFAPNYMLGNNFLLKHAPTVQGCAELMTDLIQSIDAWSIDNIRPELSFMDQIIGHPSIKGVTLTGSTRAGKAVAQLAGKHIKPSVLELGGSNGLVITEQADLNKYADAIFMARFQNTGQSCIAAKRIFVHETRKSEVIELFQNKLNAVPYIHPADQKAIIGPMARIDLAIELENQVDQSIALGATKIVGGERKGAYFPPTLLTEVTPEMPVFKEETFGPVACLISYSNDKELIEMVNNTSYGLGNSIFSEDIDQALHIGNQLNSSALFINDMVKSDPRLPFGGIENSGYGRELGSEAMFEFCNVKTTAIQY